MGESFLTWDAAQVGAFVAAHSDADVAASFIDNAIDGALLPFLTTAHLRELGVPTLGARLRVKRALNDLMAAHFASAPPPEDFRLAGININLNYVSMEALALCLVLLRDMPRAQNSEVARLADSFSRLKADLHPLARLAKDAKPLPTPTLDPGVLSPTALVALVGLGEDTLPARANTNTITSSSLGLNPNLALSAATGNVLLLLPSPTNRFSSASVLSMGVGKVADMRGGAARYSARPRLLDADLPPAQPALAGAPVPLAHTPHSAHSTHTAPHSSHPSHSSHSHSSHSSHAPTHAAALAGQPLKQLKASSDDTCLKVLQHAMRRHHIPREKWSKYVLVICYGDKERILKLTERPVGVFKELTEHGKNPAIMLRELALTPTQEYEDSRIGDDIPGGTL